MTTPINPSPKRRQQLFKILDGIGTEADIRCILIGGTVQSHLKAISSAKVK